MTDTQEKLYYGFDRETHHAAERIIEQEIIQCASSFIEHKGFFNMFKYDPYEVAENLFMDKEELMEYHGYLEEEAQEAIDYGNDHKEIFEWWQVSEWLYNKLRNAGQPVMQIDDLGWYYWGRTCTGQAIILDGTIQQIVKGL